MARFSTPDVECTVRGDGATVLRSRAPLGRYARCVGEWLERWAREAPDRIFVAERDARGAWTRLSYGAAHEGARRIGQGLVERGLGPERPVLVLSENGVDHALLALGAMQAGIPIAPVSTAYSRISSDFAKLRHVTSLVRPGLVYARNREAYGAALDAIDAPGVESVSGSVDALGAEPGAEIDTAYAALTADSVAKILFTSGSTGVPKGVVNTHGMLCSNQQMIARCWPFVDERPPVIVDWLPWSHTFGGNHNFNLILRGGGTLYVDEGRPVPGLVERTVENLRAVSPTLFFNVPRGYAMLLDHLERDRELAAGFFRELDVIFYAAAALPQSAWARMEALVGEHGVRRPAMVSAWGLTETAPMATCVHYSIARAGNVGVPAPGCEIALVPAGEALEARVRGPNVTPGYWRDPPATRAAFDARGFLATGDAMRFADDADPSRGLVFGGRLAENFKLSTGSWVVVGPLRIALVASCAPLVEDCVIAAPDRDELGLLAFPSRAGCAALAPRLPADAPAQVFAGDAAVRGALADRIQRFNDENTTSTTRVARALLLDVPPSIDAGEITDKGYLNQRRVLANRARDVERLFAPYPDTSVIVL